MEKRFVRYVSQNILGMLGNSAYILADTFFIARAAGANGIAALNLVLPIYSLIFAIGAMIGLGSATRFKVLRARKDGEADLYFSNGVYFCLLISVLFVAAGIFMPDKILAFLGGDEVIIGVGTPYTRIFLLFTPFFMLNYVFSAFVRNDDNPTLAMVATFSSSIFNIIMDYVFMFPLGMGMAGAALATAFSPVVGMLISSLHFFSKKSTVKFRVRSISVVRLIKSCALGVSAFVGEMASGVTTLVFNIILLKIAGNVGVAAYGIVANIALVCIAIFNGITQGVQPLLSESYGKGDRASMKKLLKLSLITAFAFAIMMNGISNLIPEEIVAVFNSEGNKEMSAYAVDGLQIYFIGFLFAGINIVGTGYLSATEAAVGALVSSISRGFVAIALCAVALATILGMTGVWLAFPAAEAITLLVMLPFLWKARNHSAQVEALAAETVRK
ncbi:MAG: MATE family efflux transporter [Lachnospiraceae bacterium]|nr:MATE family efflux transporter [Lachnospiraceae bacterium]